MASNYIRQDLIISSHLFIMKKFDTFQRKPLLRSSQLRERMGSLHFNVPFPQNYHFPNFVIIHGVLPFAGYHSIKKSLSLYPLLAILFLSYLSKCHLLLIVIFETKRKLISTKSF